MIRPLLLTMAVWLAVTATFTDLEAQRLSADLRGTLAQPTQSFAGTDLNTGFGFGATLAWRVQEHLHLFGGWDWLHFRADQSFAGADVDFEQTGYAFGLRFEHPLREGSRVLYRVEGAGTWKHLELENEAGDLLADSGHDLGFEIGAGLVVPFGVTWSVAPMLRYGSLTQTLTVGGAHTEGSLRHAALEVGLAYRR